MIVVETLFDDLPTRSQFSLNPLRDSCLAKHLPPFGVETRSTDRLAGSETEIENADKCLKYSGRNRPTAGGADHDPRYGISEHDRRSEGTRPSPTWNVRIGTVGSRIHQRNAVVPSETGPRHHHSAATRQGVEMELIGSRGQLAMIRSSEPPTRKASVSPGCFAQLGGPGVRSGSGPSDPVAQTRT